MILTCPSCSTRYFADGASLSPKGRAVRCAACGHTWHAAPDDDAPAGVTVEPEEEGFSAFEAAMATVDIGPTPTESVKARRTPARPRPLAPGAPNVRASLIRWGSAGAVFLVLLALAVVFRYEVVRVWPQTATAYAAAGFTVTAEGLVFENVAAEPGYTDGETTLTITASVRNTSGRVRRVPPVRIGLYDDRGDEVFSWAVALGVDQLTPRQSARFTAMLAQPPADAHDLELRFAHRPRGDPVPAATELLE